MPIKDIEKRRAYDRARVRRIDPAVKRARANARRARDPEKMRAYERAYYAANRLRRLAYLKQWRMNKVLEEARFLSSTDPSTTEISLLS